VKRRALFGLLGLALAAACTAPELRQPATVTSARPPLVFAVAELAIEDESQLPAGAGFRDRQRSERLVAATRSFLEDRLQTTSGIGWLQVAIDEARILEEELEMMGGIRGAFTREPDRVLDALVRVRISVMGADGLEQAFTQAEVQRRRPILQGTSVIAQDAEAERLIGDIMSQLDDSITQAVRQHLSAYLLL